MQTFKCDGHPQKGYEKIGKYFGNNLIAGNHLLK